MNTVVRADEETGGRLSASKARLRLWLRILSASRLIEAELRERLREDCDTTLPRFDVLAALYRSGDGLKMSELSGVLMVSNGNVTGIVDRLAIEGLVVRAAGGGRPPRDAGAADAAGARRISPGSPPRTRPG